MSLDSYNRLRIRNEFSLFCFKVFQRKKQERDLVCLDDRLLGVDFKIASL